MCESKIFIRRGGKETCVMEEAVKLVVGKNTVTCYDILGAKKEFAGARLAVADLVGHKIILEDS